jgi:cobalt-zinc-cadmium efflux system protein
MGAGHAHGHGQGAANQRRLAVVLVLSALYMGAEVAGGLASNSLALLADAGHMLSDVAALALAMFAAWMARRPANSRQTFGFHRTEILAALVNGALLVAVAVALFVEAWRRLSAPPEVEAPLMMAVAAGGLAVNLASLWVLHGSVVERGGGADNLNIRGAWLHVLTDALGSVQALAAGALIWRFDWRLADPIASALIGVLVLISAWRLLQETLAVLMESAPGHIDVDQVRAAILGVEDVRAVHDLHVWTITSGRESLSAHVVTAEGRATRELLADIRRALHDGFGIHHVTVQVEPSEGADDCEGCEQESGLPQPYVAHRH